MLATSVWFPETVVLPSARTQYQCTLQVNVHAVAAHSALLSVQVAVFLATYLLACGDIEANPGPLNAMMGGDPNGDTQRPMYPAYGEYSTSYTAQPFLERIQSELSFTLNQAITRMETSSSQQGRMIEQRLKSVEDKIDRRLLQVEQNQAQLATDFSKLHSQCESLWTENQQLHGTVQQLVSKCDYLENQSRRNNLLFFGVPGGRSRYEDWEESERKIRDIIRHGMDIQEEIEIERAHRTGKAIVVKFLSYKQKMQVLSNAKKLKDSECHGEVFVREDFSETVQEKRRALLPIQQEMRQKGYKANLRFDKLVTREAVFHYDPASQRVTRQDNRRPTAREYQPYREERRPEPTTQSSSTGDLPSRAAPDYLLPPAEFPPLPSRRDDRQRSPVSAGGGPPVARNTKGRQHDVKGTSHSRPQQRGDNQRDAGRSPKTEGAASSQQQSSTYNLRTRSSAQTSSTPPGAAVRGYGRGRGKTPPSQVRIDSMLRAHQTAGEKSVSTPADRTVTHDSGEEDLGLDTPFEDAINSDI